MIHLKLLTLILFFFDSSTNTNAQNSKPMNIYDININALDGTPINLNDYKGKYILFVNVASECGFTNQYAGLQKLYDTYKERLMVIGVPCNQFGQQEPGDSTQIENFCKKNYVIYDTFAFKRTFCRSDYFIYEKAFCLVTTVVNFAPVCK